jgi:hypothetical protein
MDPATKPPPGPRSEKTADQLNAELGAQGMRTATRFATWILAVLGACTVYFGMLNAWMLANAEPAPFGISLETPGGASLDGVYRAGMAWKPSVRSGEEPDVFVDGIAARGQNGPRLEIGHPAKLDIRVRATAATGLHEGQLVLERVSGSGEAPQVLSVPIRVEVTGGFWQSWFVLRWWLEIATVIWVLFYLVCLVAFPAPSGEVIVHRIASGMDVSHHVPLGTLWTGRLFPWTRSAVPLGWIWKRAYISSAPIDGQLQFMIRGMPVLQHIPLRRGARLVRLGQTAVPRLETKYAPCGPCEPMSDFHFAVEAESPRQTIIIQYRQDRQFSAASRRGGR